MRPMRGVIWSETSLPWNCFIPSFSICICVSVQKSSFFTHNDATKCPWHSIHQSVRSIDHDSPETFHTRRKKQYKTLRPLIKITKLCISQPELTQIIALSHVFLSLFRIHETFFSKMKNSMRHSRCVRAIVGLRVHAIIWLLSRFARNKIYILLLNDSIYMRSEAKYMWIENEMNAARCHRRHHSHHHRHRTIHKTYK